MRKLETKEWRARMLRWGFLSVQNQLTDEELKLTPSSKSCPHVTSVSTQKQKIPDTHFFEYSFL